MTAVVGLIADVAPGSRYRYRGGVHLSAGGARLVATAAALSARARAPGGEQTRFPVPAPVVSEAGGG